MSEQGQGRTRRFSRAIQTPRWPARFVSISTSSSGEADVGRFPDGEVMVEVRENVRGGDCFVIQSTCSPPNDNLMELLLLMDALRRASAKRITAVIPYFGYARQDRKVAPRVPISAKLVADLITTAGASRVLTVDLHAGQIQGFFNIPVDNLFAMPVLIQYLRKRDRRQESHGGLARRRRRRAGARLCRAGSMPIWRLSTNAGAARAKLPR